jgi:16S rRNA (guanine(527)-N(7))-methyltransferase RsmG
VKHSIKKPRKTAKNPAAVAAEVRMKLAPTVSALGIPNLNPKFLDRIDALAAILALWGAKINLTAKPDDADEILFHVFDSLIPLSFLIQSKMLRLRPGFEPERRILDVGSGAGFPGLVIASAINAQVTLVESRRKRATFLTEAAIEMGLRNVTVEQARVEALDIGGRFDLATARAVGNAPMLFKTVAPALVRGGLLMLYASTGQTFDDAAASSSGLKDKTVSSYDLRHGKHTAAREVAIWTKIVLPPT